MVYAIMLGFISVLQAGLNRRVGEHVGLISATLINNGVLLIVTLLLFIGFKIFIQPHTQTGFSISSMSFWYLIPGMLGIFLVAGIPYVMSRVGAVQVFIPLIASQILASFLWDIAVEGKRPSLLKAAGVGVTCLGSFMVSV